MGKAPFQAQDEIGQLQSIWSTLGTPRTEQDVQGIEGAKEEEEEERMKWDEVMDLPWWQLLRPSAPRPCRLTQLYSEYVMSIPLPPPLLV